MKLSANFVIPTKDFKKYELVKLPIKTNIPDNMEVQGDIEYSVVMPDFMFNEVADTEPKFRTKYDVNGGEVSGLFSDKTITRKFKKTQTAKLISFLQNYFSELTQFINDKHSIEKKTIKKKLIIDFKYDKYHTKNNLNGAYMGEQLNQSFRYFVGYELMTDKMSNSLEKKVEKNYISKIFYSPKGSTLYKKDTGFKEDEDLFLTLLEKYQKVEDFDNRYVIIDWTQEREDFFKNIKDKFDNLNQQLSTFINNIDDDKIEELMSNFNNTKLLE